MGYSTDFFGSFKFDRPISEKLKNYINNFSGTRRMSRDNAKIKELFPNWKDYTLNGNLGIDGEFFAKPDNQFGQSHDDSIINYNRSASTQPGLWCQWIVSDDGTELLWDGGEKFYAYDEWLEYIIDNFIATSGYVLNGKVKWEGENSADTGTLIVENNRVSVIANF